MDYGSATMSLFAVLAALNCRKRTGIGQDVDLASREVPSCFIGDSLMDYIMNGRNDHRDGNRDAVMAPHNCYPCQGEDAWISIAVSNEDEWSALCRAIGDPSWAKEERFADMLSRWKNQEELDKLIGKWTVGHPPYEAMHVLQKVGVAAFPSMTGKDIFTDPHIADRGFAPVVDHPLIGKQVVVALPFKLSVTPGKVTRHAPMIGEHNSYVLGDLLGLTDKEIKSLIEEEVVC
ncbi:MAG: CoA transferase, partial [Chloroflexota bacterium]